MNKKYFYIIPLLLSAIFVACTSKSIGYTISGSDFDALNGKTVVLLTDTSTTGQEQVIDSFRIENGAFSVSGKTDFPMYLMLSETTSTDSKIIFLENAAYTLKGTDGTLANAAVESVSPYNNQLRQLVAFEDSINKLKDPLYNRFYELEESDTQALNLLTGELDALDKQVEANKSRFVDENPASPLSVYLLYKGMSLRNYTSLKEDVDKLDASLKNHPYTRMIQTKMDALAKVELGQIAPDFSIADIDGNIIRLSDYRGKYVLLDFWASWCMPCRKEFPHLLEVYKKHGGDNFDIFGISLDDNKDDFIASLKEENLPWKNASELKRDNPEIAELYAVSFIPKNYLIAPDGKIVAVDLRGDEGMAQLIGILSGKTQ